MSPAPFPPPMPTVESLLRNLAHELQALLDAEPLALVRVPRCFLVHWLQQLDRVRRLLPDTEE